MGSVRIGSESGRKLAESAVIGSDRVGAVRLGEKKGIHKYEHNFMSIYTYIYIYTNIFRYRCINIYIYINIYITIYL